MSTKFLAATTIEHNGIYYTVSTIDRESSAVFAAGSRYAETLVWRLDEYNNRVGGAVAQADGPEGSLWAHFEMAEKIRAEGVPQ